MIPFLDLKAINARFTKDFEIEFQNFLNSGQYILGEKVSQFEAEFASYCGVEYCVGTSNGLDALTLIFKAYLDLGILNKGDEVIVPANTFVASILAIVNSGLKPVFVEPLKSTFNINVNEIEAVITKNTKAILAVHLYGQLCDMEALKVISNKHDLLLIEDAAQAHGAVTKDNIKAGALGDVAAFSFYPAKNLGALGDAGAITTNDKNLAHKIRVLGNYGSSKKYENNSIGYNHRLDTLQASVLSLKLKQLDKDNLHRREIANEYLQNISNSKIKLPFYSGDKDHVFHLFVVLVKDRNTFQEYLSENSVESAIHYPIPPHQQKALSAFKGLKLPITEDIHKHCVSLPISPILTLKDVKKIINIVNNY